MTNYDLKYSTEDFYWGLQPDKLVVDSIQYLPPAAKVLDLGCGEGRNSFFLAKNNFKVTAVDISEPGIKKVKKFARQEKISIKTYSDDINSFLTSGEVKQSLYDAIFCLNSLQFVSQVNIINLIKKIKLITKPQGFNIISSFIAESSKQREAVLQKGFYYFNQGELLSLYQDWKSVFYEEKIGHWETHGASKHRHFVVNLMAQNKSNKNL